MTQIDATGLTFSFDALDPAFVAFAPGSATPFSYTWTPPGSIFSITALSAAGDITAALAGEVNAITISATTGPGLSVTGLDNLLTDFIDAGDPNVHRERFWDTILAGETDILVGEGGTLRIFGDSARAATGETVNGASDRFVSTTPRDTGGLFVGDVHVSDIGSTVNGGADLFRNVTGDLIGDVAGATFTSNGTVNGGRDTFLVEDTGFTRSLSIASLYGDIVYGSATSAVVGGDDSVTVRNVLQVELLMGDAYQTAGALTGGDDTILVETTIEGRPLVGVGPLAGDVSFIEENGNSSVVRGGDDTITLRNANGNANVHGDFVSSSQRSVIGGDDTIRDFDTASELLDLSAYGVTSLAGLNGISQVSTSLVLDIDGTNSITLLGVDEAALTDANFVDLVPIVF